MKRSEFYAMMIIVIIMCSMSTVFAVSYQPQIIQPTKPYQYSNNLSAGPDSPNTSLIPILLTGVGICSLRTSQTALPNPPITECSSHVKTRFLPLEQSRTVSLSIGLSV